MGMQTLLPVVPILPVSARSLRRGLVDRVLAAVLALVAVLLPVNLARAQGDEIEDMAVVFNPLTHRSVDLANRTLGLDADQLQVAKDLYVGYRAALRTTMKDTGAKANTLMEKAREDKDYDAMRKGPMGVFKEAFEKVEGFERSFNADLKAVLTQEQEAKFPSFERARRRENARLIQLMAGEGADVVDILYTLKLDSSASEELKGVLADYEMTFDRAISERQTLLKEFLNKVASAGGGDEMEAMTDFMPKLWAKAKAGRDVNRQTARRVSELLPEADRARFDAEVRTRSFPSIYKATATGKKLDAAKKFEDLTEDQKGELTTLQAEYVREIDVASKEWSRHLDTMQEEFGGDFKKLMMGEEPKGAKDAEDARTKRVDLEKQYLERLEKLLSKAQGERLPAARPDDEVAHVNMMEPELDREAMKDWKEGEE